MTFEEMYEKYYNQIFFRILKRMKQSSYQDAEDVADSVFFYAYNHLDNFDRKRVLEKAEANEKYKGMNIEPELAWLLVISRSRLDSYFKSAKRRGEKISDSVDETENIFFRSEEEVINETVYLIEMRIALANALKKLPEKKRQVVVLSYFSGLSSKDIAGITGMSETSVRVTLSRALKELRKHLDDDGFSL